MPDALSHLHEATRNMAYGAYERHELAAFGALLTPGHVVADVGANVGYLTAYLAGTEVILSKGYGRIDQRPSSKFTDISEYEVPAMTLSEYFATRDATRLRLVKLDVEGQERQAIQGMAQLFATGLRPSILTEVTVQGSQFDELKAYAADLFALGYKLSLPESLNQFIELNSLKYGSHRNVLWTCSSAHSANTG